MSIHSLRGFRDLLPADAALFASIEAAAREVFALYGYQELRIPTIELKELFVKSTGDTTDNENFFGFFRFIHTRFLSVCMQTAEHGCYVNSRA